MRKRQNQNKEFQRIIEELRSSIQRKNSNFTFDFNEFMIALDLIKRAVTPILSHGVELEKVDVEWKNFIGQYRNAKEFISYICRKERNQKYSIIESFVNTEQIHLIESLTGYHIKVREFYVHTKTKGNGEHPFIEFLKMYRYQCEPYYFLDFSWGMSSGESSLLGMFANLYYLYGSDYANHIDPDYAVCNIDRYDTKKEKKKCDTLLMMIDEADLTYHPEWQRCFLANLTVMLPRMFPKGCFKDIQIILTTHSPLLLGDIPGQNVIYLYKDIEQSELERNNSYAIEKRDIQTFGQNLYAILNNGFAMEQGAIGDLAKRKINRVLEDMEQVRNHLKIENIDAQVMKKDYKRLAHYKETTVAMLADGIIKNKLIEEIDILLRKLDTNEKQKRIERLLKELKQLEEEV